MSIPSHPAATIFPLMDGVELAALADDIRAHGLLDPIVLLEGQVLDGRNRLRACEIADVTPTFVEWADNGSSPTEWVVSHNLHRRHLTTGQRAALALDLLPRLEKEARERQASHGAAPGKPAQNTPSDPGRSDEKAAELVGVGRSTVAAAKAIQQRDETGEIVDGMRSGDLNVAQASRAAGFTGMAQGTSSRVRLNGEKDAIGKLQPSIYFGKGDKWNESTEPLRRYLTAHRKRGFDFAHVNNREATKRIQTIDQLLDGLTAARAGLEQRSHRYRLTA